ncbi:MAG: hypothetical protein ACRD0N_09040 [Acidimicrobiales bacterium]
MPTAAPEPVLAPSRPEFRRMMNLGGAALISGVMMVCENRVAAAVRLPDGSIRVEHLPPVHPRRWALAARQVPFARGLAALAAGLSASVTALLWSARVSSAGAADVASEPRLDQIETAIAALQACATDAQRAEIDAQIDG